MFNNQQFNIYKKFTQKKISFSLYVSEKQDTFAQQLLHNVCYITKVT